LADTRSGAQREAARNRAQKHFTASEQRDVQVRQLIEGERSATSVKTAKLRALRLAKEEEERILAASAPPPVAKPRARKPRPKTV
jgi:hypothetical protein